MLVITRFSGAETESVKKPRIERCSRGKLRKDGVIRRGSFDAIMKILTLEQNGDAFVWNEKALGGLQFLQQLYRVHKASE